MRLFILALSIVVGLDASAPAQAGLDLLDQWHQWRGPLATGESPRGNPPLEWDESRNIAWKVELPGQGSATPIVWGDYVFILSARETQRQASDQQTATLQQANAEKLTKPTLRYVEFLVTAIRREDGRVRWQRVACERLPHEGKHATNTFASASPVTDGQRLYASFGSHGVYCYDFDGNILWSHDLGDMQTRHGWGEGASPTLSDGQLYVNWDHEQESYLYALDARTGKTTWKVGRDEPTSWSTPLVVHTQTESLVIVSATNRVRAYDALTGHLIWQCSGLTTNVVASPVCDENVVYCMSWYGDSSVLAIPLDSRGDVPPNQLRWTSDEMAPYCPSPLLYRRRLYLTLGNTTIMSCIQADTGEKSLPISRLSGLSGNIYASPVAANGHIYYVGRDGTTTVYRHDSEFVHVATNRLTEPIDASPAIVGEQLFLRGQRFLYCLEDQGP